MFIVFAVAIGAKGIRFLSVLDFISSVDLDTPLSFLREELVILQFFFSVITHYHYTRALLE